jgi:diguanylate cyclase (GGDEF)-like protein
MFLLTALTVIVPGMTLIRVMLRPLQGVEDLADAICNNRYPLQEKLPRTRELRRVVEAMNRLSRKAHENFTKHAALTDRLRTEAYRDALTGLGNRRWFDQQLQHRLQTREPDGHGALLLVALQQLDRVNAESGYPAGDRLLLSVAQQIESRLKHYPNGYLSRISGADFGILVAGVGANEAETLAGELAPDLTAGEYNCHIGMTMRLSSTPSSLRMAVVP